MVKNHRFEPKLTNNNAKIGYKATKKGLKPICSCYQTYAFNMALITVLNTILNTPKRFFEYPKLFFEYPY